MCIFIIAMMWLVSTSCLYGEPNVTSSGAPAPWAFIGFTADGADVLNVAGDYVQVDVTAPSTNTSGNSRVGWIVDTGDFTYNEVCATWTSHTGVIDQPGLIVHFDGTHAVTMTQNVWFVDRSGFNFHVWDLSRPLDDGRLTLIGSFKPTSVDGAVWPIRACLRAVGPYLDGKVWSAYQPEPEYGDPAASGGALIVDRPGRGGWYAGHVDPNQSMTMTLLSEFHE